MKKLLLIGIMICFTLFLNAQFTKATLQATGLTCALCSNAINKALQKVSFVESVQSDIKNSAFNIIFKNNAEVDIDALKAAVEDAGFSVGGLKMTGSFNQVMSKAGSHIKFGNAFFHILESDNQVLNGEKTISIVDKNYVSVKQFRKINSLSKMPCVQTGKAEECCTKDGVPSNARVYHVII